MMHAAWDIEDVFEDKVRVVIFAETLHGSSPIGS